MMIDDRDISPYSGLNDKPLPKKKVSEKDMKSVLKGLFRGKNGFLNQALKEIIQKVKK